MEQRSFGTHDGSFHADEVTACSLLLLFGLIDRHRIYRTRDPKRLLNCHYVCDVGGEYNPRSCRFDHHQAEYKGTMSSAGMVLLYLKEKEWIESHLYDCFLSSLILGVDAHDNGVAKLEVGTASFSQIISNFLPIEYEASDEEMNRSFLQAVDFTVGHLDRLRKRHSYTLRCRVLVQLAMSQGQEVLLFDQSLPWIENFFELGGELHPAQFVIMPAKEHWKLRAIPPSLSERMKVRTPLPESWAGLRDEQLQKESGIQGAIFCHKGRFISIWKTKEDALRALRKVLAT